MTLDQVVTAIFDTLWNSRLAELLSVTLKGDPGEPGSSGGGTAFGGRLTLVSGEPVMTSDQIAKQVVYYAPVCGDSLPMVIDGEVAPVKFLSGPTDQVGLSLDMAGSSEWPAGSIHDLFSVMDGETPRLATRQWDSAMLPTEEQITGGTAILTSGWTNPSAAFDGDANQAHTSCARLFPATNGMNNYFGCEWSTPQTVSRIELVAANNNMLVNNYSQATFIKIWGSNDGSNWFMIGYFYADCTTNGNTNSCHINVSDRRPYSKLRIGIDPGGESHSINIAEFKVFRAVDTATRRLTRFAGLPVNDAAITVRHSASETVELPAHAGTYLGTVRMDPDAPGRITAHESFGPSRMFNIWNAHNRRKIVLSAGIPTANASNYLLSQQRWAACQNETFSLDALVGLAEEQVTANFRRGAFINAQSAVAMYEFGIGVDTTTAFSGTYSAMNFDNLGQSLGNGLSAGLTLPKYAGSRKLIGLERGRGTVHPAVDQRNTVLEACWFG